MDADNTDIEIIVGMYRQRKFADALQETNSRLKVHPDSFQLYNIQGMINIALKQDDEAILSFNNAIERSRQEEEDILVRQLLIQKNYNDFVKQKELNSCYFNKENDEETEYEYSDSDCEYSESE